ncbi:MAG: hypothetical protein GX601_20235 [Anaerolineales bacterium]|nr:hypothetical protein [Anaerolineales bacterium]
MAVSTTALHREVTGEREWLHSRDWDLTFISLSVVLVTLPYLSYLGLLELQSVLGPIAAAVGTTVDDLSRNIINGVVALIVGGPHMYATFQRTALDRDYVAKHKRVIWSSVLIPIGVISMAVLSLQLLLTVFFFWASIHVLHQIIYITELYNHKRQAELPKFFRFADYGVVLTSLYPLAAVKIASGNFVIGVNDISAVVGQILGYAGLGLGPWMVWLAGSMFGVALVIWLVKTYLEWRQGMLHPAKTLFIAVTVVASFFVPALGNLDTAFQGMNLWHSLQYLALTWMLLNLRQRRGELERSPFVKRMASDGAARKFYLFNIGLTIADVVLAVVLFAIMYFVFQTGFDFAFDRAYYMAILSFLLVHYYHDHFLFAEPDVIIDG